MKIIKAKNIGFCAGVNYTIKKTLELISNNDKVYCLGELVHNTDVINDLKSRGVIFVEKIEEVPDNSNVIFRAHGEPVVTYEKANGKNLNIIDLTCGKVAMVHKKVEKNSKNYFVIIVGKRNHPEIIATKSYAGDNSFVIENFDDIDECYKKYLESGIGGVYVCSQTTYSVSKFNMIVDKLSELISDMVVENTICKSTIDRQNEVNEIACLSDKVFVVGDKLSSNTKELFNNASKYCNDVSMLQNVSEIENFSDKYNVIGIVSGASTPKEIVDDICDKLLL